GHGDSCRLCRGRAVWLGRHAVSPAFRSARPLTCITPNAARILEFMGISDRLLGKKNVNGKPHIEGVSPAAALPGGEIRITGSGLRPPELRRPRVQFGDIEGAVVISSDDFLVARVPDGATSGPVVVATNAHISNPQEIKVAVPIAEGLHPVTNPALDAEGNIYAT